MGLQCFKSTPYKSYSIYMQMENLTSLKEQWPPIKLYKLKKLFEQNSHIIERTNQKALSYQSFINLLPQLSEKSYTSYLQIHKKRLFQLFDKQDLGYLTWNHFFVGYTLCEFGSEQILAILMFALFDKDLKHTLTKSQLNQLLNCNSKYLREDVSMEIDEQTALEGLLHQRQVITIQEWIDESEIYIDYFKYKKMFSVWAQQQLQKNMAQNFNDFNSLFDQNKNKYVGYLINYKWFQSWKTYIHKEYGIQINGFSNNLTYNRTMKTLRTQRSFKTKKAISSIKSTKSIHSSKSIHSNQILKKTIDFPRLRQIQYDKNEDDHMGQYNLIYSNIGDKPAQIYNNLLQGEYSEILIPELIENIHYIIVSEEVWKRLKLIYGAYPQFRRTGEKSIQIYPKNFRIFTRFHKGRIDFQQQKICEFSNFIPINSLISKILQIQPDELDNFQVFFKTCSMFKWEQLQNISSRTSDVSSEQIIFLAVVLKEEAQQFMLINCVVAQGIKDIHIGDQFIYIDPVEKRQKRAIFLGKQKDKMIVHFRGTSYIYDLCLERQQFIQRSFLCKKVTDTTRNRVRIEDLQLVGLPNSKGLGFINSLLLSLFSNEDIYKLLTTFYKENPESLIEYLASIAHMLANAQHARTVVVSDMIRKYFYEYLNFEFTMCEPFIDEFFDNVHEHFSKLHFVNFQNPISDYLIEIEQTSRCSYCQGETSNKNKFFSITLPIPDEEIKYYEIIYIPYAYNLKGVEFKRYTISLHQNTTFKQYKEAFEKVSDIKHQHYFIAEIHGNNIVKNYMNAKDEATLEELLLREDDLIFAFELCFRLDVFVSDHYTNDPIPKLKNLKVGQMIDFEKYNKHFNKGSKKKIRGQVDKKNENLKVWNFGKITRIDIEPYTHKWSMEIEYRQNRVQIVSSIIYPQKTNIAFFPTKSYLYCDQFHIKLLNRIYNQVTNEMQVCNIPLVVMIGSWMRMKEVELLVYQQVRHLIADNYKFKIGEDGSQQEEGQSKMNKKQKIKKFKEYLYNSTKPYRLIFTDLQGRCSVCCKIQKSQVCKNQEEFICDGCQIDDQTPVFWQIRPYQTKICVDWISLDSFVKPYIADHSSYTTAKAARKNCIESLDQCLNQRLKALQQLDKCCCQYSGLKRMICAQSVMNIPQRLIFIFDRMIEEEQNYKRINRKYIHFEIDQMIFYGECYQLVAATSIEGSQVDAKFVTYLRDKNHWLEYNGEHVKMVKKSVVQKICALLLQYKRVIKNEKRMTTIRQ